MRADIRVREGASIPVRYCDVVITHPIHWCQTAWRGRGPAVAVGAAERDKLRDYRPGPAGQDVLVTPLAFETGGRWGPAAAQEVRRLARKRATGPQAAAAVNPESLYRASLTRWRREISVSLQVANAEILLESVGRVARTAWPAPAADTLDLVPDAH